MDKKEFTAIRKRLTKTQKQMAELLGTSLKAVHSYEQGWRNIPVNTERMLYFLVSRKRAMEKAQKPCWITKKCPPDKRNFCPAWEFRSGNLCWFISGTICEGVVQKDWKEKMKICKNCDVWSSVMSIDGER